MLIMQIFFVVVKKQYNRSDELINQLQNMANRNLHKEEYYRPIQFIRLLLQIRKAGYQIEELRQTEKYLDNLAEHPFTYRGIMSQFEPLPLEKLWQVFLDHLD